METVVEVVENAVPEVEDKVVARTSSDSNSLKLIPDPVVYQLVRVDGDGKLVPATDDEVMEVEDLLEDGKCETRFIADIRGAVECSPIDKCSSDRILLKSHDGLLQCENLEVDLVKSGVVLDSGATLIDSNSQSEDIISSTTPATNDSPIHESGGGQCSAPQCVVTESGSWTSNVRSSWKPDFSRLRGKICLDNLSVRELHETFRATFGRETSVKDKQWLKRRIAMGLSNSCDFSTTTFFIEDNRVVKEGKEERSKIVDAKVAKKSAVRVMDEGCETSSSRHKKQMEKRVNSSCNILKNPVEHNDDSKDTFMEQRAVKRVRKPTRRYIEEVSEGGEDRENSGKLTSQVKTAESGQSSLDTCVQPVQNVRSGKPLVTRKDSLGGSGVQIPYVSRVRRGRPRENVMALMELQTSGMGIATNVVKKAFGVYDSQPNNGRGNKAIKAKLAPAWAQQPVNANSLISKSEKAEECVQGEILEFDKDEASLQQMDSSGDNSYDNAATVRNANGGMRRKHHRPWTLSEVVKLVEGVARYGAGRWSEIKRVSFASYSYRTSVDLKDKWRNLLRASFAQLPMDTGVDNSRKPSYPVPASVLVRVRELAEMQAQVPPNLSLGKSAGQSGRSVHETRSGYL